MKNIVILICIVIMCLHGNSQESVIRLSPEFGQGYVVLDELNHDVNYWELQIFSMEYDSNGEIVYELKEIIELVGKNYTRINNEYITNEGYSLRVIGHLGSGNYIQEDIVISKIKGDVYGGIPYDQCKTWICNGLTYGYEIRQMVRTNDPDYTYLKVGLAFFLDNPIYQYFDEYNFNQISNNTYVNWPGMNPIWFFNYYAVNYQNILDAKSFPGKAAPWIIKIAHDNMNPKYDGQNNIITSNWIYGVAKGLGPWSGSYQNDCIMTTPGLTYGPCYYPPGNSSIQNLNEAILIMNTYTTPSLCGWPDYICNVTPNAAPPPWLGGLIKNLPLDTNKLKSILFYWDLVKLADKSINGENTGNWWEKYHSISLTDLANSGNEIFNVKISDVIIDGIPDEIPIYIPEGLYLIGVSDNEGNYIPIIKEVPYSEYEGLSPLANELSVNIYPVPHTENCFNMALSSGADAEMVIQYKLFNNQSHLLHESTIIIGPEASETLWTCPDEGLTTGILYHTYMFEDASYKTVCTVKN